MSQNQNVDNDLQQAIDNITSSDGSEVDMSFEDLAFSNPVAAPSTVPEGDSGELGEPVGPFPMPPADDVAVVTEGPEPMAPLDPVDIPDLGMPPESDGLPEEVPESVLPPEMSLGAEEVAPEIEPPKAGVKIGAPQSGRKGASMNFAAKKAAPATSNVQQLKEAAMRDLVPLIGHLNMDPEHKFALCQNILENLHDASVLDVAYQAAAEIQDEDIRAQALLYIIECIK